MDRKNYEIAPENGAGTGTKGQGGASARPRVNVAQIAVILAILGIIAVAVVAGVC